MRTADLSEVLGRGVRSASFVIGGTIAALFLGMAVVAVFWTPDSYIAMNIPNRLQPPSAEHCFGTDQYGRDVLSMIMKGSHNSLIVALVALAVGMGIGVPLGLLAAARRGMVDEFVMRLNDFAFAFPALLTAVMITALFGPGAVNAIIAIGIFNIPVFARLTRGAGLVVWQREFVMAARASGKGGVRISLEHVLPNVSSVLIVQGTIQFALAILAEAGLSYLGLGAQPPQPSWGKMLAEAQTLLHLAPHLVLIPGLVIAFTVLGLNLFGDGLRDLLDPRLRRRR
jgi:peptide/nickel transport system permease protein